MNKTQMNLPRAHVHGFSQRGIKNNFGYKLIGTKKMKREVVLTLLQFPQDIIEKISTTCWFVGSFDDGWAFVLRGSDVKKGEYVIFLSDELMREDEYQIHYTIAHEIGHVILGHRNSIDRTQSKSEIKLQEKEAHRFALKYLSPKN